MPQERAPKGSAWSNLPPYTRWLLPVVLGVGALVSVAGLHRSQTPRTAPEGREQSTIAVGTQKDTREASPSTSGEYSESERQQLLELARQSLEHSVRFGRPPELPKGLPPHLLEKKGCFVTLTQAGQLRGCIGHIFPQEPLAEAVLHNARSAALRDARFSPVTEGELAAIKVEVSVLSVPRPLAFGSGDDLLHKLRPHHDGVVLNIRGRRSTFLPQVWEQLPDPAVFLGRLSAKAGHRPDAWRDPGVEILIYHAEAFDEPSPRD